MGFTKDQQKAFDLAISGASLFITGGAGTGKTFLLQNIIDELKRRGRQVIVCAPTGTAALKCGGVTIHRAFGFRSGVCINEKKMTLTVRCPDQIKKADVIIIDEISMCRVDMFDAVQASIEKAEKKTGKRIQVIVCGDFYQLPPVIKEKNGNGEGTGERDVLERYYGHPVGRGYAFSGNGWDKLGLVPAFLAETVRQKDPAFVENLNRARIGDASCLAYFNARSQKESLNNAIYVCGRNDIVNQINCDRMKELPDCEDVFEASVNGDVQPADMVVPEKIALKVGARVMITVNDIKGRYCNGSTGTVVWTGYEEDHSDGLYDHVVTVKLDSTGNEVDVGSYTWPVTRYVTDGDEIIQEVIGTYMQIPVKPAYAMTIHKSQGATIERLNLNPSCWDSGQLYVALSRVTSIEGLYLEHPALRSYLLVDETVVSFYKRLKEGPIVEVSTVAEPTEPQTDTRKAVGRPRKYRGNSKVMRIPEEIVEDVKAAVSAWTQDPNDMVIIAVSKDVAAEMEAG